MDYKKVLITGGQGQLGYGLFYNFKNIFNVLATSKNGNKSLNIKKLDITKYSEVKKTIYDFNPDIIINCAAITDVDYCENHKSRAIQVNVDGLYNIIKGSNKDTKIIHFSTDYIFDGSSHCYEENSFPNPINYYGKTKLESENLLRGKRNPYIIIRPNTVYSAGYNNFFTWVYNSLKENKSINVVSDQISNPSYVLSIVNALIDMIIMNGQGIYHHGSCDSISRYDFSLKIARKFKLNHNLINPVSSSELNQLSNRPRYSILDTTKIEKDFNLTMNFVDESLNDIYKRIENE